MYRPLAPAFCFALLAPALALAEPPLASAPAPASAPAGAPVIVLLAKEPPRPRLRYSLPIDLTITGLGGAAWITSEVLKSQLAPSTCGWCNPPGVDTSVKNGLRWSSTRTADALSYVTGFALAPIAAYGLDAAVVLGGGGTVDEWAIDALVITEAIVVAADINQLIKFSVGRERPFVHDLELSQKNGTGQPSDNNLSFFSGHTTLGFVAAVSAGTVASLKGYRAAPWIWAGGLSLAAATGYLRIAADRHYLTDVLVGTAVGSAVGLVVPLIHRPCYEDGRPCVTTVLASPAPAGAGGAVVGLGGVLP